MNVTYQTKLIIDSEALKHNFAEIKKAVGDFVEIAPVVKANGYGSSAEMIADLYGHCPYLAVGDIHEADSLRKILPQAPILLLYQPFSAHADAVAENDYVASVSHIDFTESLNDAAKRHNKKLKIHIEIDTGMGRQGVLAKDSVRLAKDIHALSHLEIEGLWTHYACADSPAPEDLAFTRQQTDLFKECISGIENAVGAVKYKHACASAAIFNPHAELFNMVRPGLMLYGYYPSATLKDHITLKPALKLVSVITQIKDVDEGFPVSYNRSFITTRKSKLATVPVGYQHGLSRTLSNKGSFVINGQLAPIRGFVCMDYTIVDITDIQGPVSVGDEIAIFDNVNMTVEKMASLCDTINYEIISKIHNKGVIYGNPQRT
ncbi:MAG: alanine racemase [Alphaproteobacteria bacterium]|nr:alanine racemase [Alphaproteobacteria bacterium]